MCGDCWNAAMGAPAAVVAARFAWVGYKDRLPFVNRRSAVDARRQAPSVQDDAEDAPVEANELVESGAPPP